MLTLILRHFGFPDCVVDFFSDYLIGRSTQYSWNSFLSDACDADVGHRVVTDLMVCFGLVMEHNKSEIFHFSRAYNDLNPELDLSAIGAPTLKPKTYWRYLGFYFDRCLSFKEHVRYYSTKTLSTVKAMDMLGNSTRGLLPL